MHVYTQKTLRSHSDKSFSLQASQLDTVYQPLSGIDGRKSERLDNIPNKLLKIAATVIAPSLTGICPDFNPDCTFHSTLTALLAATFMVNTFFFPRKIKFLFYSILFYSILFYSILFYSILFYSILFYSILFYSILFYSILFYSILLAQLMVLSLLT